MWVALPEEERNPGNWNSRKLSLRWEDCGVADFRPNPDCYRDEDAYADAIQLETPATIRTRALRLIASREGRG